MVAKAEKQARGQLDLGKEGVVLLKFEVSDLESLEGKYDTVVCLDVLIHYPQSRENIRRCVCIIYDPLKSNQGVLALKALKLSDSFMELYRRNNFRGEKLREKNLSWVDIFEEIPYFEAAMRLVLLQGMAPRNSWKPWMRELMLA